MIMKRAVIAVATSLSLFGFAATAADYQEAPILGEMVQSGALPPVDERLPANPRVIEPLQEVGTYGGTIRRGSALLFPAFFFNMTREPLITYNYPFPGEAPPQPNLAESWTFNDEGTEMTIKIREGVKWSDGAPFTTDDIMFFWNDVMLDEETSVPVQPALFVAAGVVPELEQIDALTIKLTFPFPYKYAEQSLAAISGVFAWPKHLLSQFHPRYNSKATYEKFNEFAPLWSDRSKVTLGAWMLEEVSGDSQRVTMVRNPYYWKVDTAGNQLPYIDRVENIIVADRQAVALGNITGEFDFDGLWTGNQHLPLFLKEQKDRDYQIGYHLNTPGMAIYFNYDNEDENIRTMVSNTNFRQAFSLAINRDAINRLFFLDLMEPSGWSFNPNSPYYEEETGKLFSDYDPEQANLLLDEAGFIDNDGDGIRELPNGAPLKLVVDVANHDLYVPIVEYLVDSFPKDVGIELIMNNQQQDLILERRSTPNWQLHVWDIYGSNAPLAKLEDWIPVDEGFPFWNREASTVPFSPEYAEFSSILGAARGMEYDERVAEMKRANRIQAENVFNIHLGYYKRAFIYANRLGNMIDTSVRDLAFGLLEAPTRPEQLYVKN